jgi:hypothetical protein
MHAGAMVGGLVFAVACQANPAHRERKSVPSIILADPKVPPEKAQEVPPENDEPRGSTAEVNDPLGVVKTIDLTAARIPNAQATVLQYSTAFGECLKQGELENGKALVLKILVSKAGRPVYPSVADARTLPTSIVDCLVATANRMQFEVPKITSHLEVHLSRPSTPP